MENGRPIHEISEGNRTLLESTRPIHKLSEGNKTLLGTLIMLYSYQKKNLPMLCSCHENLNEAELKSNGLTRLLGRHNIQSVAEPLLAT